MQRDTHHIEVKKVSWALISFTVLSLTALSAWALLPASVPAFVPPALSPSRLLAALTPAMPSGRNTPVTDDTALYQNLSEIRVAKQKDLNFDSDLSQLSASEHRYREKLPPLGNHPRIKPTLERISQQPYTYSGGQAAGSVVKPAK